MSLINQMLKELDARQSESHGPEGAHTPQVRAVAEPRRLGPIWTVSGAAGLLAVAAAAWWYFSPSPSPSPATAPEAPAPVLADVGEPVNSAADDAPGLDLRVAIELGGDDGVLPAAPVTLEAVPPAIGPNAVNAAHVAPAPASMASTAPAPMVSTARPSAIEPVVVKTEEPVRLAAAALEPIAASPAVRVRETAAPANQARIGAGQPPATAPRPAPSGESAAEAVKQVRELTPTQRAENEFRRASQVLQQGRQDEALGYLDQALRLDARHTAARQAKVAVLLELRRGDEALRHAREGVDLDPQDANLAMILARLQVDRQDLRAAIATLERGLPHALERADYLAFLAALQQRDGLHRQAVDYYLLALRQAPQNGLWWMGLGISLQAEQRNREAEEAFLRAKASNSLSPELLAFVEARLSQLK